MSQQSKNLVIIPAGDDSVYLKEWDINKKEGFDLFVVYYGNSDDVANQHKKASDYFYRYSALTKLDVIKNGLLAMPNLMKEYDYFFMPDDDVSISIKDINRLFDVANEYGLELCQPACDGYVNWEITRRHPDNYKLRYVNAVEAMMPCFSRNSLNLLIEYFTYNRSMWSTELIWSFKVGVGKNLIAIVDDSVGTHTKPMAYNYQRLYDAGINPKAEAREIWSMYKTETKALGYERPWNLYNDTEKFVGVKK